MSAASTILAARDITKVYGSTRALRGVDFDIERAKVTSLFGENGAGKSTLMKILSGVVMPTSGHLELDGERVSFASANEARARGISIIHQELSLAPNLSVRDNIFMGREIVGATGVDFAAEEKRVRALMAELGYRKFEDMVGQRQMLDKAKLIEQAKAKGLDFSKLFFKPEPWAHDAMPREVSANIKVCAYMPISVASRVSNGSCMKIKTAWGASKQA